MAQFYAPEVLSLAMYAWVSGSPSTEQEQVSARRLVGAFFAKPRANTRKVSE